MRFPCESEVHQAKAVAAVIGCGHIDPLMKAEKLEDVVKKCLRKLRKHRDNFTAVAVTGYSSTIIGSIIAAKLKKHICIVRKEDDNCHSGYLVEGMVGQKYIFLDDLISSGKTFRRVVEGMKKLDNTCYGVYLYLDGGSRYTENRLAGCGATEAKLLNFS